MARIFLSHSSKDEREAVALKHWLADNGWDDVFLDIDPQRGLAAGERWQEALRKAADRCEAVVIVLSPAWAKSKWCLAEFLLAKSLHKQIFGVVVAEVSFEELPSEMTSEWQLCHLVGSGPMDCIRFRHRDAAGSVTFLRDGLDRLKMGLNKAGLSADFFPWPPKNEPCRSPFRGLEPLDFEDAAVFFGRDLEILRGLDVLRGLRENPARRVFVILGASGSGKSSFLRAGLLPRLARDDRHFLPLGVIRPETAPISGDRGLAKSLARTMNQLGVLGGNPGDLKARLNTGVSEFASILSTIQEAARARLVSDGGQSLSPIPTLVLPVDQAEELFNADAGPEARQFLNLIAAIQPDAQNRSGVSSPAISLIVAFTIRSDRYEPLQTAPELAGLQTTVFDDLKPMPSTRFREVIMGPARRASVGAGRLEIKSDLLERLVEDCTKGADTLPLLSLTLERLYHDYGGDGDLRLDEYVALGGLGNIIRNKLESVLDRDGERRKHELEVLRSAFVPWLVTINPQNDEPMRRLARRSDLPVESLRLVDALAENRLLTRDERNGETVIEVAHETLLRQWDTLAGWLQDQRAELMEADALERQSREWKESGFNESWLWGGQRLLDALALAARPGFSKRLEGCAEFLHRSRKTQEEHDAEKARIEAEKLQNAAALALARTKLVNEQVAARKHAEHTATRARRQFKFAAAFAVAAVAFFATTFLFYQRAEQGRVAAGIAAEKERAAAERAEKALTESQRQLDRSRLEEGRAWLAEARSAQIKRDNLTAIMLAGRSLGFVGYGREQAAAEWQEKVQPLLGGEMKFDHDAESERFGEQRKAQEFISGIKPTFLPIWINPDQDPPYRHASVAFSPDGTRVASSKDELVKLWDAATGKEVAILSGHEKFKNVKTVAFSPDGTRVVSGADNFVKLWSVSTCKEMATFSGHSGWVTSVAFSPNGLLVASGAHDNTVKLWSVATGKEVATLSGHSNYVNSVAFSPDGTLLATGAGNITDLHVIH